MKMPVNKAERMKIMILIAIGILAVLFTIIQLVVTPFVKSYGAKQQELASIKKKWYEINQEMDRAPRIQKEYQEIVRQIGEYYELFVQKPTLGTYYIGAQSLLESACTNAGVQIESITEIGEADVPGKNKDGSPHAFRAYSVRLSCFAGFRQWTNFVATLEHDNLLASISEMQISAREDNFDVHRIICTIQWPVLVNADKGADSSVSNAPPDSATGRTADGLPAVPGALSNPPQAGAVDGVAPRKEVWE